MLPEVIYWLCPGYTLLGLCMSNEDQSYDLYE